MIKVPPVAKCRDKDGAPGRKRLLDGIDGSALACGPEEASRMNAMKPGYAVPIRERLFFVDLSPSSVQRAQNQ